jgi:hypothetical protein
MLNKSLCGAMWPCSNLSNRYNICLVKREIKKLIKLGSYEIEMVKEKGSLLGCNIHIAVWV